jgi:hypothetical protein
MSLRPVTPLTCVCSPWNKTLVLLIVVSQCARKRFLLKFIIDTVATYLRYSLDVCLDELVETTKNFCTASMSRHILKPGTPERAAGLLTARR